MAFSRLRRNNAPDEGQQAAAQQRVQLATITTAIASRITRRMGLDDVLNTAVNLIRDSYPDVYHVQIFLNDEAGAKAQLAASTGEVGRQLLARQHALDIGGQSVIGQVTDTGEAIIARAGDGVHRRNELLPETQLEAAFPLRLGERVIGALDIQSTRRDSLNDEDAPILQALADTLAVGVDNARLIEQMEQRLAENQRLLNQTRTAAAEVERLNQQLTQQAWEHFLRAQPERDVFAFNLNTKTAEVQPGATWSPALVEALEFDRVVQGQTKQAQVVAVPIRVRGQVIGAIEFEAGVHPLDETDIALIQTVCERLGFALDNARLYAETRRAAQRETTLNTINSRMQTSNQVDAVLAEAARSLQTTLGAQRVAIRLGAPRTERSTRETPAALNGGEL